MSPIMSAAVLSALAAIAICSITRPTGVKWYEFWRWFDLNH